MAFNNLGSIQRKLSAIIEDFKRSRDTWEEINSHSFTTANALTNSVIQSRYVDESKYWHPLLKLEFPNILQKYDAKMQHVIDQQSNKLLDLVEKMNKQYNKMKLQYRELLALYQQLQKVKGDEFVNQQPIFLTCSLVSYVNRMTQIIEMYDKELKTKRSCLNGFKDIQTREEAIVSLSIWIQQPNISQTVLEEWEDICTIEIKSSN